MIISHKYKFIFFANPKTGSSSIHKALRPYDESQETLMKLKELNKKTPCKGREAGFTHVKPQYIKKVMSQKEWNNYFKFVFVRNPWDWFLSQYNQYFCKPHYSEKRYNLSKVLHGFVGQSHPNIDLRKEKYLTKTDFYILYYLNYYVQKYRLDRLQEKRDTNRYFQYQYIVDDRGEKQVDFVGKYENIEHDFEFICHQIGLNKIELPCLNYFSKNLSYRDYYREDTKALVAEKYQKDIELLNYEF